MPAGLLRTGTLSSEEDERFRSAFEEEARHARSHQQAVEQQGERSLQGGDLLVTVGLLGFTFGAGIGVPQFLSRRRLVRRSSR